MSWDALGQLKHLKTARARWPFPDEEPVTWHTNHLIAERVNRTPAAVSVCAGMHASGCEGLAYQRNCQGWVSVGVVGKPGVVWVRKWVAHVLMCFRR